MKQQTDIKEVRELEVSVECSQVFCLPTFFSLLGRTFLRVEVARGTTRRAWCVVTHLYKLCTWEGKGEGRSRVQDQSGLWETLFQKIKRRRRKKEY